MHRSPLTRRGCRWIAGALMLAMVAGCSQTRLAYRYADWGVVWWVEDYISLTDQQETRLNEDLQVLRQWHCSNELPRYQQWLTTLEQDLAATTSPGKDVIFDHQARLTGFLPSLLQRATPVAANLLSTLSDEQVSELARNMAENQKDLEQEMLEDSVAETAEARAERTAERFERWLGELSAEQQELIETWSAERGRQTEIWLRGRANWQTAFLDALEQRKQPDFEDQLEELIMHSERARGTEYQTMLAASRVAMSDLMHALITAGDTGHREHLLARARELNGDFAALTCS